MSKKPKNQNQATETREQKFERIANRRAKTLAIAFSRLTGMPKQPSYKIEQSKAIALTEYVTRRYNEFMQAYDDAVLGKTTQTKKDQIEDVF